MVCYVHNGIGEETMSSCQTMAEGSEISLSPL